MIDLLVESGGRITTTEDHRFYNTADKAWQPADQLDPGDQLHTADGGSLSVEGLDWLSAHSDTAYNLSVNDIHTYFVRASGGSAGVLVHNDGCGFGSTPAGRPFTYHYGTETGPQRNIPGSVVDEVIDNYPGKPIDGGKTVHYDPKNNVTVVTGDGGAIVSVRKGAPRANQR